MSTCSRARLSSYASLATAAATGVVAGAHADLLVFDVGTTFTATPVEGFGGSGGTLSSADFTGVLELAPLGTSVVFFGLQFRGSNPDDSASFFDFAGWTCGFDEYNGRGGIALDSNGKWSRSARQFMAGDSVGSSNGVNATAMGGKAKSKNLDSGSKQSSFEKGVMEGRTYLGFQVEAMGGVGDPVVNYGWLDLTIGRDETGALFLTINRWAYESDGNVAARIPGDNPVPGVGGLVALAMGAAGVRRRRERVA